MPIKSDILSSSFAPQIRDFDNSSGSNKLKGGITEFIQAEYSIRLYWYAEPSTFTIIGDGAEIIRNDGKSFIDDGFQIDDAIIIKFGFGDTEGQNDSGTITSISEDGFTLFTSNIDTLTDGNYDASVECLIVGLTNLPEASFRFGLIENNESFNTFSKVTGDDQKYYISDLSNGVEKFGDISGTIKGWASQQEVVSITQQDNSDIPIFRDADFGGLNGTVPTGTVLNYIIKHRFPLLPFYVVGQLQNLQNGIAPSFLQGDNSLKHVFECVFKQNLTDQEDSRAVRFQNLEGSIGFFDELFNGFQTQYSVTSVAYEEFATGNNADSIIVDTPTKVSITLNSADGTFSGGTEVVAVHSYLPADEDEYLNSQDYFDDNFAFEAIKGGSSGSIITSVSSILVNANTLNVELVIDTSGVKPDLTAESNYLIAITTENQTLPQENADRTTLLVDLANYDKSADIPDLFFVDEAVTYDHVTDDTNAGYTDYKGWIQDGYEVKGSFRLDRTKFAFLSSLFVELVAWKDGTDEYFTIQSNSYNLTNAVIDGDGNQQINIEETQGFLLDELDQFNKKDLTTGVFDGTFINYDFAMGLKINWQDWLSLEGADTVFYDASQPNNGLNQNSSRYSLKEGYTLQTILRADVLEEQQGITTEYIHKIPMNVNDFGEISSQDWSVTFFTLRDDNGQDANGKILGAGKSTRIQAVFTPNFATTPDINLFEGIIRIVEQLPQGDKTIYELSTVRTSQANNLLIPLTGEALTKKSVVGSDVVLECRTDASIVQNVNYTISARLYGGGEVIVGDYNDDFSNDFFV